MISYVHRRHYHFTKAFKVERGLASSKCTPKDAFDASLATAVLPYINHIINLTIYIYVYKIM